MSTILSNGSLSLQDFICFILKCFITSIISLESGYGTSALAQNNNNFGGVTGSGDAGYTVRSSDGYKFAKYSSVEAGLDAMAKNLASYSDRFSDVNSLILQTLRQSAVTTA